MNSRGQKRSAMQKMRSPAAGYLVPATLAGIGISFVTVMILLQVNLSSQGGSVDFPFASDHELKKFSSYDEMSNFLSKVQAYYAELYRSAPTRNGAEYLVGPSSGLFGGYAAQESFSASNLERQEVVFDQSDYSGTNVQVAGIDEADFLKNDGKYAYILSGSTLTIVDAYPPEKAKIESRISIDIDQGQGTQNMFLNGDRLVVFYQDYGQQRITPSAEDDQSYFPTYYEPRTHMMVIDVSDRGSPKVLGNYDVTGQYSTSRMIGDKIFMLTVGPVDYQRPERPTVTDALTSDVIVEPDVHYFAYPQENYAFNTVTMLDLGQLEAAVEGSDSPSLKSPLISKTFMIGAGATVYVSEKNVYIAYQEYHSPLPASQNGVTRLTVFTEPVGSKTVIHKISIQSGSLFEYVGKGAVPGWLLSQFSMDERGGRLTVATTSEQSSLRGSFMGNNVYKLDEKMVTVGKLEGIAEGESIYASRFDGDRLYLVTFRQIDPFFVVDLSGDQPRVLGELKLPGFSNYLHPYDGDHVLGIGREGSEAGSQGVKVALFDVSEVSRPRVLDTYTIGDLQTDSEVLRDHKALLFDKERNILSIPISSFDGYYLESRDPLSKEIGPWNGFYIFGLSPQDGVELKETIRHDDAGYEQHGTSHGSRSFFIMDTLYTVTENMMKLNDMNDFEKELNSISLRGSAEPTRPLVD